MRSASKLVQGWVTDEVTEKLQPTPKGNAVFEGLQSEKRYDADTVSIAVVLPSGDANVLVDPRNLKLKAPGGTLKDVEGL